MNIELKECKCGWKGTDSDINNAMAFNNNCVMMMDEDWEEILENHCPRCRQELVDTKEENCYG